MYLTNLISQSQRILNQSKFMKLYNIMNNMKYSFYIRDFNPEEFAENINAKLIDRVFSEGAYAFEKDNNIIAVFDVVTHRLFTNDKNLIESL